LTVAQLTVAQQKGKGSVKRDYWSQRVKLKARIGVSAAVLTACCVIVLGDYPVDARTWAFFMFGLVIGHWLR
jgi:hypothetical protein